MIQSGSVTDPPGTQPAADVSTLLFSHDDKPGSVLRSVVSFKAAVVINSPDTATDPCSADASHEQEEIFIRRVDQIPDRRE